MDYFPGKDYTWVEAGGYLQEYLRDEEGYKYAGENGNWRVLWKGKRWWYRCRVWNSLCGIWWLRTFSWWLGTWFSWSVRSYDFSVIGVSRMSWSGYSGRIWTGIWDFGWTDGAAIYHRKPSGYRWCLWRWVPWSCTGCKGRNAIHRSGRRASGLYWSMQKISEGWKRSSQEDHISLWDGIV